MSGRGRADGGRRVVAIGGGTGLPVVLGALKHDGHGYLIIPDKPGIGVELAPDAATKHPYKQRWVGTRLNADGSVMDQ